MNTRAFTLIEVMVSVAIFAIVMVTSLGALLAMSESDRKAQALKSVINNLNFSIDSMSRTIRTGQNYHCNASEAPLTAPRDCTGVSPSPELSSSMAFLSADPSQGQVYYCLGTRANADSPYVCTSGSVTACPSSSCSLLRSVNGAAPAAITAPEVFISSLKFSVAGAEVASLQPKVTILLQGAVKLSGASITCTGITGTSGSTCFALQTSVTQRLYDQN